MADSIVRLKVEDNSFNAQIKESARAFATFGKNVASAGTEAFRQFATGATNAKVAFQGFNAALKANALVMVSSLAIQAASAIGEMIGDWVRGADDAASAQENLNQKLEETKRLLDEMKYFDNFQMQIDKASGMATTDILQRQFERAQARFERAKRLYTVQIPGTQAYTDAEQMMEKANADMVNAQRALQLDAIKKANGTGEYASRGGGGGRGRSTTQNPGEKILASFLQATRKSLSTSSTFRAEEMGPSSIWQAFQTEEVKQAILSPYQMMQAELKSLTAWRDAAGTDVEWQKRDQSVRAKQNQINEFKGEKKPSQKKEEDQKLSQTVGELSSGVSSIVGGIQQLGIEIPEGLTRVVGSLQAITSILVGIEALIEVGNFLGIFHAGGVVHAANGFAGTVPGSRYSGDHIPILANAGEVVLTRAMAGNLASQLNGNALADLNLTATIRGEQIRLAINNNGRRTGRGEYVQTNRMKG